MLADCPQPASHTQIPIMAADEIEPCRLCQYSDRAINPILPKPAKCLGRAAGAGQVKRAVCLAASAFAATNPLLDGWNGVAAQTVEQALRIIVG